MKIMSLEHLRSAQRDDAARILFSAMAHFTTGWNTLDDATEEVAEFLEEPDYLALAALDNDEVIGWIGAIMHSTHGWELHPIAVAPAHQGKGHGTTLVSALESLAQSKGVLTIWLGTDDDFGGTTLYGRDLFPDPISQIKDLAPVNQHPFTFYQKLGYTIVGVLPDVDGPGKHDILMAKSLKPYSAAS